MPNCKPHGIYFATDKCPDCIDWIPPTLEPRRRQVGGDHYIDMGVQPWDVVDTWPLSEQVGYFKGNALKYLMRAGSKGDAILDLDKCTHYLEQLKKVLS